MAQGKVEICGVNTAKLPLLKSSEKEALFARIEEGDFAAREKYIEGNLRLVLSVIKRFSSSNENVDDLFQIGCIGLMKAIGTYRSDRNIKLATYASRCIDNEILMYIRKNSSHRADVSIDEPLNTDWDGNELLLSDVLGSDADSVSRSLEKDEDERILHAAVAELDERERTIINLRYGLGGGRERTQKEVADMLGISQSYISRLEKKIISRLRESIGTRI